MEAVFRSPDLLGMGILLISAVSGDVFKTVVNLFSMQHDEFGWVCSDSRHFRKRR